MIGPRAATKEELNYTFRRVLYELLLATKCVVALSTTANDYSAKELRKIGGLIVARNLNDFFFVVKQHRFIDDIDVTDFELSMWRPDSQAKLNKKDKSRINKIAGHIVARGPDPFKDDKEISDILQPLIVTGHQFVLACQKELKAEYTGRAADYRRRLNGLLPSINLSVLPKW